MEKFARRCDATGKGMNEGYVVGAGDLYFANKSDLIEHLRALDWEDCNGKRSKDIEDEIELLNYFYNEEYYYWAEWEEPDYDIYYDAEGNEYEL